MDNINVTELNNGTRKRRRHPSTWKQNIKKVEREFSDEPDVGESFFGTNIGIRQHWLANLDSVSESEEQATTSGNKSAEFSTVLPNIAHPVQENASSRPFFNFGNQDEEFVEADEYNDGDPPSLSSNTIESSLEQVIMGITWQKGKLGAASYSASTSEITVMNDIVDINPEFFMTKALLCQIQPNEVVTCRNVGEKFLSTLNYLMSADETEQTEQSGDDSRLTLNEKIHFLKSKECSYDMCKRRVLEIHLPNDPYKTDEEGHLFFMEFVLNFSNQSMIIALGMLLKYLDKNWMQMNLNNREMTAPILLINSISLENIVTIDMETYDALQVFSKRVHPSHFKMWTPGSSSEGFSIFSLFNRCKSKIGSKFLRNMLLSPTRDTKILSERLDTIEFFQHAETLELQKNILSCIKNIKNVTTTITKMLNSRATSNDWKCLHNTLYNSIILTELCVKFADRAPIFAKIASCPTSSLYKVLYLISQIVDFPESTNGRPVVKLGLDIELDQKKQEYANLQSVMTEIAELELPSLPHYIGQCSMLYVPEIGFLTAIPFWKPVMEEKDFHIKGLKFLFASEGIAHYKTPRCKELDARLGDAQCYIIGKEARILLNLTQYTCENIRDLYKLMQLVSELDCLIAMGTVAKELGYHRPHITDKREITIVGGRHPLQELCIDNFVQNDTHSSEVSGLMTVLTGPNASGKSVYLKQVALITYLAHIGSFVPAETATIGVVDHIHTRIQTEESIAVRLSAFLIDLKQMSTSLLWSSESSLIVIDEFGKGTDETSGLSLLTAALRHYLSRGVHCPHVFVSTHFHRVVDLLEPTPLLKFQTMEYILDEEGMIVYLFKLKDGNCEGSMAFKVAENHEVPAATVERAKQALTSIRTGERMEVLENKQTLRQKRYVEFARKYLMREKSDMSDEEYNEILAGLEELTCLDKQSGF